MTFLEWEQNMGDFLIVSLAEDLHRYKQLAQRYQVGFEVNDFYDPRLLDDEQGRTAIIQQYKQVGIPAGSTMHGAFYDVSVFSYDAKIREISKLRMRQSMEIAGELAVKGVVFHTNCNPMLSNPVYDRQVVEGTCTYMGELLEQYPDTMIYMENMFDSDPEMLVKISERLAKYSNYGVCLDYAHAHLSDTPIVEWITALHPYIRHLHINDNDLKRDQHLAVGAGKIDWQQFRQYYDAYFSQCSVLIETTPVEQQLASLEFLSDLAIPCGSEVKTE